MKTEAEIKAAGMQALSATLGLVETERFLAAVSRDKFDYTQWRRSGLPEMDLRTLAREANKAMPQQQTLKHAIRSTMPAATLARGAFAYSAPSRAARSAPTAISTSSSICRAPTTCSRSVCLQQRLAEITGRSIDLIPERELSAYIRTSVLDEAVEL